MTTSRFPVSGRMIVLVACAGLLLPAAGCGKKADVKTEVTGLEKAFATPAAPQAAAQPAQPAPAAVQSGSAQANAYVNSALAAVRQKDYAKGVIALQNVAQTSGATPEQLMAVERTKQAIINDLVTRADRGDASAKAALAAIEKSRSQ